VAYFYHILILLFFKKCVSKDIFINKSFFKNQKLLSKPQKNYFEIANKKTHNRKEKIYFF
jgi:hypothetical protein